MNTNNPILPKGFEALQPFVGHWAKPTASERARSRSTSLEHDRKAFYASAKDLLDPALKYLDTKPLNRLDQSDQCLMHLMLGFAHCAQAVEVQREQEDNHARLRQGLTITQASADQHPLYIKKD